MQDGIIQIDSAAAKTLGFTGDKFHAISYLWKEGSVFILSFITSRHPGAGHFRKLLDTLEGQAEAIIVPSPSKQMWEVLEPRGYVPREVEFSSGMGGMCATWGELPKDGSWGVAAKEAL